MSAVYFKIKNQNKSKWWIDDGHRDVPVYQCLLSTSNNFCLIGLVPGPGLVGKGAVLVVGFSTFFSLLGACWCVLRVENFGCGGTENPGGWRLRTTPFGRNRESSFPLKQMKTEQCGCVTLLSLFQQTTKSLREHQFMKQHVCRLDVQHGSKIRCQQHCSSFLGVIEENTFPDLFQLLDVAHTPCLLACFLHLWSWQSCISGNSQKSQSIRL